MPIFTGVTSVHSSLRLVLTKTDDRTLSPFYNLIVFDLLAAWHTIAQHDKAVVLAFASMLQSVIMPESYLDKLPTDLKRNGDHSAGEIEIIELSDVDDPRKFGVLYEDAFIVLIRDKVRFPNGKTGGYIRVLNRSQLEHPDSGGTVMVPIWNGKLIFIRVFRHSTRQWEWELPRGFQEPDISKEENAEKEIKEELGVGVRKIQAIGNVKPNTGILASSATCYRVDLEGDPLDNRSRDKEEAIGEVKAVALEELDSFIREQPVTCGFSLSAILLARAHGLI